MPCFSRLVTTSLLVLCLPLTGLAGELPSAPASKIPSNTSWLLTRYDINGDSVISTEEISQKRDKVFSKMDFNQDGNVSIEEFTQLDELKRQPIVSARFGKLDTDRDGVVTKEEYRSYLGSFKQFDQDGNGLITTAEMDSPKTIEQPKATSKNHCLLWVCIRRNLKD